jgi:hypothetical protein
MCLLRRSSPAHYSLTKLTMPDQCTASECWDPHYYDLGVFLWEFRPGPETPRVSYAS